MRAADWSCDLTQSENARHWTFRSIYDDQRMLYGYGSIGSTKHCFAMNIWLNEFLQNAAFPAVVLAFACAPINDKIPDLQTSQFIDDHRGVVKNADSLYRFNEQGNKVRAGMQSYIQTGSLDRASEVIHMLGRFRSDS